MVSFSNLCSYGAPQIPWPSQTDIRLCVCVCLRQRERKRESYMDVEQKR